MLIYKPISQLLKLYLTLMFHLFISVSYFIHFLFFIFFTFLCVLATQYKPSILTVTYILIRMVLKFNPGVLKILKNLD